MNLTKLKDQAVEMLFGIPDDKMFYVIDILKNINSLLCDEKINVNNIPDSVINMSPESFRVWEEFKEYKGIIDCSIDEKAELAEARNEKYASIN